jgi:primosomal protein N' (replication factor Y)
VGRVREELRRALGDVVGDVGADAPIWVGTERDLPKLRGVDLGVVVDADGMILGSAYHAAEEALRILARLASSIPFGSGRRLMVQTIQPRHPVVETLVSGDPLPLLRHEIEARRALGLPPAGEVIVLEVAGGSAVEVLEVKRRDGSILGPATARGRERWLIQGPDLSEFKTELRQIVQRLRDHGATVRVDVDPLDL